jgi:hypothetical protein
MPRHQTAQKELLEIPIVDLLELNSCLIRLLDEGEGIRPSQRVREVIVCKMPLFLQLNERLCYVPQVPRNCESSGQTSGDSHRQLPAGKRAAGVPHACVLTIRARAIGGILVASVEFRPRFGKPDR